MRLYTIPPGTPFLAALTRGLVSRWPDQALLARGTVLVPDAEVAAALRATLARHGAPPLAVRPIGTPEATATWLEAADLPPALPGLRRRLLLARLVAEWSRREAPEAVTDLGAAVRLADSLGDLLDDLYAARRDLSALDGFVPDRYAGHRRVTLDFLAVLRDHWPRILAAEGALEPAERHGLLLDRLAAGWRAAPPDAPVVAAGFAATGAPLADLLGTVAGLPDGAVVLPGLDTALDEAAWHALGPTHPQWALRGLLGRLGAAREAVMPWPAAEPAGVPPGRIRLMAEVLRPATTTEAWADALQALAPEADAALAGLERLDAPAPREAAAAVALMLRDALAAPGARAALVTPDAGLARRVAAELRRWNIVAARPGPAPLGAAPDVVLLRLLARAAASDFAPVPLLALLKHPRAGAGDPDHAGRVRRLDRLLRGPRPVPGGLAGIRDRLADEGVDAAFAAWFDDVAGVLGRFAARLAAGAGLDEAVVAHRAAASALAGGLDPAAAELLAGVAVAAAGIGPVDAADYAALFTALAAGAAAAAAPAEAARLAILHPDQAALHQADLIVLAGLDEGVWPEAARSDPWLNRPMRLALELPPAEAAIGHAAFGFGHAACAPRAVLVRARRRDGAPAVPSRWLVRLGTLARGLGLERRLDPDQDWLGRVAALDAPGGFAPAPPPRPTPPSAARPVRLSAGEVETLMRDPYTIYARHVLGLRPLPRLDADPGAAERGQIVHLALERFVRAHADGLPPDAVARLAAEGQALFDDPAVPPAVAAFWSPRFARTARWFVEVFEAQARARGVPVALAAAGSAEFDLPGGGGFTLTARIDRVDRAADGSLALYDYTTGRALSADEADGAFSPRLLLTALVAAAGGLSGVPAGAVAVLAQVLLRGVGEPGAVRPVDDLAARLAGTRVGLVRLLARFADPATPYAATAAGGLWPGPYDHLARRGAWADGGDGDGEA